MTSNSSSKRPRLGDGRRVLVYRVPWALVCEVAWTRVLEMILGPTTYAFGDHAGGGHRRSRRRSHRAGVKLHPRKILAVPGRSVGRDALVAGAGTAAGGSWGHLQVPLLVGEWTAPNPTPSFCRCCLREATIAAALPASGDRRIRRRVSGKLALAVGARAEHAAADASRIYAANTTGAIAGSLAGGFVLIPAAGLRGTLVIAAGAGRS